MSKTYTIKARRTNVGYGTSDYTKTGGVGSIVPAYGELVYNNSDTTLQVGNSAQSTLSNLPIIKFFARARAAVIAFLNKGTPGSTDWKGALVTIEDEAGTKLFPRTKFWTNAGTDGIPVDSAGTAIQFTYQGNWFLVDKSSGEITSTAIAGSVPTTSEFPVAKKIPITGVTSNDKVQVSLALSNADRKSVNVMKSKQKVFGTFCDVESYNGGIYIVVKKVVQDGNCYLNVIGG